MLCSFLLYRSNSVIHIFLFFFILFSIVVSYCYPRQDIAYNSLWWTFLNVSSLPIPSGTFLPSLPPLKYLKVTFDCNSTSHYPACLTKGNKYFKKRIFFKFYFTILRELVMDREAWRAVMWGLTLSRDTGATEPRSWTPGWVSWLHCLTSWSTDSERQNQLSQVGNRALSQGRRTARIFLSWAGHCSKQQSFTVYKEPSSPRSHWILREHQSEGNYHLFLVGLKHTW